MDSTSPSKTPGPAGVRRAVLVAIAFAFWLLIVWPVSAYDGHVLWGDVVAGLAVALIAALIMREIVSAGFARLASPRRYAWALAYLFVFTAYVIRGNVDVAYRVLHPAMPIRPGIVAARTRLRTATARTLLANSITLTPGTLTVDIVGDVFFIHCIHVDTADEDAFAKRILARFEGLIAAVLE